MMRWELRLNYPWKFTWQESGKCKWIGCLSEDDIQLLANATSANLSDILPRLKGNFALVIEEDNMLTIATDTAASFPIFYNIQQDKVFVADTIPAGIADHEKAIKAYRKIFCTEGENTLLKDWKTVQAGQILSISSTGFHKKRWFRHDFRKPLQDVSKLENRFLTICENWAKHLQALSGGQRKIWVPLSGGYDSRLILCVLKHWNVAPLAAYTYGRVDSHEYSIAKEVCEKLGVEWHFVPYEASLFEVFHTTIWTNYAQKNHHCMSVPHEQDFFALFALRQKGILHEDFIAVPGYCGDISGGSFLRNKSIQLREYILEKHDLVTEYKPDNAENDWSQYQEWLCENRLSKFIVNSVRAYEHFGGTWYLPMWDSRFLDLMYSLSPEERLSEKTYLEWAFRHFFEPMKVAFRKPSFDSVTEISWKENVKKIVPEWLMKHYRIQNARSVKADPCNLNILYEMMYNDLADQSIEKNYQINELHAEYCLRKWIIPAT